MKFPVLPLRFAGLLLCLAGLNFAQEGPQGGFGRGGGRGGMIRFSPILSALDADHDGVISASELANAPAALKTLDKNGDGKLTEDELRPQFGGRGRGEGRGPGRGEGEGEAQGPNANELVNTLMAFDKNGDGKLTKDEVPERMQGIFDRADANKDGVLTREELLQSASRQGGQQGARGEGRGPEGEGRGRGVRPPDPAMQALDADGDGVISAKEIANATKALKKLDKNADGQLTEDELRPNFGPNGPGGGPGRPQPFE
jgi:Ca2+-binding EF-hand superfamily protein